MLAFSFVMTGTHSCLHPHGRHGGSVLCLQPSHSRSLDKKFGFGRADCSLYIGSHLSLFQQQTQITPFDGLLGSFSALIRVIIGSRPEVSNVFRAPLTGHGFSDSPIGSAAIHGSCWRWAEFILPTRCLILPVFALWKNKRVLETWQVF